jgi:DNA-binding transcriptional LysR family regulator
MDRIDLLRVFVRIAGCGSFSAAANQLGLPRPTVSTAMQQLEARLGVRLLHRTTRRVALTQDGEALLERAQALIADIEEIEQQFAPAAGAVSGRLRVDMPSRIARRVVAPALPELLERHPRLIVDLGSTDRMVDLVQEGIDCALRVGALSSSSLVARPIGRFDMINCASPAYLARYGTPRHPRDLERHVAVDYISAAQGRAAPWEWQEGRRTRVLAMRSRVSANNAETYIALALAGLGLIQIPAFDVQEHVERGELVEVLPQHRPSPMPVHVVHPHRHHVSLRLHVFASWLEALLRCR